MGRGSESELDLEDIDLNEDVNVDAQEDEVYPTETEPDGYDVATGEPVYDTFDEDPEEMERLYEERLAARRAERQARYRARAARGEDITALVPAAVAAYIEAHQLYR